MTNITLEQLFESTTLLTYKAGEVIMRSEDMQLYVYRIKMGHVRVYSSNSRGEEFMHIIYGPGELFPLALLEKKIQHGVCYEALDTVKVYRLLQTELFERVSTDIQVAREFNRQLLRQFNVYVDRVDNLIYKFGRERLAYRILFLAGRFGKKTARGVLVDVPITQKTLGSSINLSRETVARELRRLEERGLVTYEDRKILILDVGRLCKELRDPINVDFWGLQ